MVRVGIRELKAHLSAYVSGAHRGNSVVITDRGTVVARLMPARDDAALQRLIDDGLAMPPAHAARPTPEPRKTAGVVSDLAADQRA